MEAEIFNCLLQQVIGYTLLLTNKSFFKNLFAQYLSMFKSKLCQK